MSCISINGIMLTPQMSVIHIASATWQIAASNQPNSKLLVTFYLIICYGWNTIGWVNAGISWQDNLKQGLCTPEDGMQLSKTVNGTV